MARNQEHVDLVGKSGAMIRDTIDRMTPDQHQYSYHSYMNDHFTSINLAKALMFSGYNLTGNVRSDRDKHSSLKDPASMKKCQGEPKIPTLIIIPRSQ